MIPCRIWQALQEPCAPANTLYSLPFRMPESLLSLSAQPFPPDRHDLDEAHAQGVRLLLDMPETARQLLEAHPGHLLPARKVAAVATQRGEPPRPPMRNSPVEWLKDALCSVEESVHTWGVRPSGFTLQPVSGQQFRVKRSSLYAALPSRVSEAQAKDYFVKLLAGERIEEDGEFRYQGQPFCAEGPIGCAALPAPPMLFSPGTTAEATGSAFRYREQRPFVKGHPLFQWEAYLEFSKVVEAWKAFENRSVIEALSFPLQIWRDFRNLPQQELRVPSLVWKEYAEACKGNTPEEWRPLTHALQTLYPELEGLGPLKLTACYVAIRRYQGLAIPRMVEMRRDNSLVFFLWGLAALGGLPDPEKTAGDGARLMLHAGRVAALAYLHADPWEHALLKAQRAFDYQQALLRQDAIIATLFQQITADTSQRYLSLP